jgi:hypothetical protein
MLQQENVTQVQTIMDSSLESIVESDGQIIDVVFTGKYKGKKLKWLEGLENMVREAAGGGILDDLSDALDIDVGGDGKKGKVRGKKGGRASRMKRRSAAWLRRMKRSATSISSKFPNIPKPAIPRIPKIPGFDKNTLKALKNNPMFKGAGKLAKGAGPAGAVIVRSRISVISGLNLINSSPELTSAGSRTSVPPFGVDGCSIISCSVQAVSARMMSALYKNFFFIVFLNYLVNKYLSGA